MNHTTLIAAGAVLLYLATRKRKPESPAQGGGFVVKIDPEEGLQRVADRYGFDLARKVEQIYRLETDNFTSGGYFNTGAAGQKANGATSWPFGWPVRGFNPSDFNGVWYAADTLEGPQPVAWVAWKRVSDAMMYLANFLHDHGGNVGRWNTTDPAKQATYAAAVGRQPTPLTNAL